MKQPKTLEEFMALPVRGQFKYEERHDEHTGYIVRYPVAHVGRVFLHEEDTVFYAAGYILSADEEGLYRQRVFW